MSNVLKNPSGLKLKFDCGKNPETGKTVVKSKTYSNLDPNASADDVYEVGASIASLQEYDLLEVAKIDNSTITA